MKNPGFVDLKNSQQAAVCFILALVCAACSAASLAFVGIDEMASFISMLGQSASIWGFLVRVAGHAVKLWVLVFGAFGVLFTALSLYFFVRAKSTN